MASSLSLDLDPLKQIIGEPMDDALEHAERVFPLLVQEPSFIASEILPLVDQARRAPDFYLARHWPVGDEPGTLAIFAWPPGSASHIHDHTCWGAICCVFGSITEERYCRLDDGAQTNYARLRKLWTRTWRSGDPASTLRPFDGGIHRMSNPSGQLAISVHLYGPRMGIMDGRDYDPFRDYVCDRFED